MTTATQTAKSYYTVMADVLPLCGGRFGASDFAREDRFPTLADALAAVAKVTGKSPTVTRVVPTDFGHTQHETDAASAGGCCIRVNEYAA